MSNHGQRIIDIPDTLDHVTYAVRPDTLKSWAWFYIEVLGGKLTLRVDDTNPGEDSSMIVWAISFDKFGVALIAGIDRKEISHVSAFVEKHGDHCVQHVAIRVKSMTAFTEQARRHKLGLLGDVLVRPEGKDHVVKQVFGMPVHAADNPAMVGFHEFVERSQKATGETPLITFSEVTGAELYRRAQRMMHASANRCLVDFSTMPPDWEPEGKPPAAVEQANQPESAVPQLGRTTDTGRWAIYRATNKRYPNAREAELGEVCRAVGPRSGQTIAEVGSGSGALTLPLARAVGSSGHVYTYDVSVENLTATMLANTSGLPITPMRISDRADDEPFAHQNQIDCVATIATFHHFDNRANPGKAGRTRAMRGFFRMLKPGGSLVLADVAMGTDAQRYFDAIDHPKYCAPNGHPHDFLTTEELAEMCSSVGFVNVECKIKYVPWVFQSEPEAIQFLHSLHNAQCSLEELGSMIRKQLHFERTADGVLIQWQLAYLTAEKSPEQRKLSASMREMGRFFKR